MNDTIEILKDDISPDVKIALWLNKYVRESWRYDENGHVNVSGNITITDKSITKLPIKFNEVTGIFKLKGCDFLSSIEGFPKVYNELCFENCLFPQDFYLLAINANLSLEDYIDSHFHDISADNLSIVEAYFPKIFEKYRGKIIGINYGF